MNIYFLGSGSKGNSTLIEYKKDHFILVDIGLRKLALKEKILRICRSFSKIDYVFVTHNHTDHIKPENLDLFENQNMIYSYEETLYRFTRDYTFLDEGINEFDDFKVNVIKTSHDAINSIGFVFIFKELELVYLTDLGFVKKDILKLINNKDYYVFECNHDVEMLMNSSRPRDLKLRIKGRRGHLSNEQSCKYLNSVVGDKTKHIFLAHVSEECNSDKAIIDEFKNNFKYYDKDLLTILRQHEEIHYKL